MADREIRLVEKARRDSGREGNRQHGGQAANTQRHQGYRGLKSSRSRCSSKAILETRGFHTP